MARRYNGNMSGQRFLANGSASNHEVHDLDRENANCQIDQIIRAGNDRPYTSLAVAQTSGFDNCPWCLGASTG